MSKLVVEFENNGKTYHVLKRETDLYQLFVDKQFQSSTYSPEDVIVKLGWLLHDDSVSYPLVKEMENSNVL